MKNSGTAINLYARKEFVPYENGDFNEIGTESTMWLGGKCAARVTDKIGETLRKYSEMGVPKADQIALPDFNAGSYYKYSLYFRVVNFRAGPLKFWP